MDNYTDINAKAIDKWVENGCLLVTIASILFFTRFQTAILRTYTMYGILMCL